MGSLFTKVASLRQVRLFCTQENLVTLKVKVLKNIKPFVGKVRCKNIGMTNLIEK